MKKRKTRKQPTIRKFHYTTMEKLQLIFETEEIRPATACVDTDAERPAVFFSIEKQWEPTANKAMITKDGKLHPLNSIDKMLEHAGLLARIEINPAAAPYTWEDYVRLSGIDRTIAKGLESVAEKDGSNVKHFYVSFSPVGVDQWLNIQIMDSRKTWIDAEDYFSKDNKA